MARLPRSFYARPCLEIAPELIGALLVRTLPGGSRLVGRVVEVEAYLGDGTDPGSHSHRGPSPRNRSMFGPPGRLYAYRSYGIHTCVNVVCRPAGSSEALLLRALEPIEGIEEMRVHRGLGAEKGDREIARGPGRLAQAMGLGLEHDGASLLGPNLHLRSRDPGRSRRVQRGLRVGLRKGAELPYRFFEADSPWVSTWRPAGRSRRSHE